MRRSLNELRANSLLGEQVEAKGIKPKVRERRIDFFRGLALVMIFINHVPGTPYETLTSRNFGFSDAAEGFVFLSGVSAALAYASRLSAGPLWPGVSRIWGRAWLLYLVHLFIIMWVLAVAAATLRYGGDPALLAKDNLQFVFQDLTGALIGLPLMTHQFGYVNILPVYAFLLFLCPGIIMAGMRWPRATLVVSLVVWAVAGLWSFDLPNFPTPGGWFLNPLAWQLLFVLGILTGLALRKGQRFIPKSRLLLALAWGFLILSLVWLKVPAVGAKGNEIMVWIARAGWPPLVRNFDKTYLTMPRLLHAVALAYVLSSMVWVRQLAASDWVEPLRVMGRNALPVFALGTILSFTARGLELMHEGGLAYDSLLILGGVLVLWAFAVVREKARRAATATATA